MLRTTEVRRNVEFNFKYFCTSLATIHCNSVKFQISFNGNGKCPQLLVEKLRWFHHCILLECSSLPGRTSFLTAFAVPPHSRAKVAVQGSEEATVKWGVWWQMALTWRRSPKLSRVTHTFLLLYFSERPRPLRRGIIHFEIIRSHLFL